MTDAQAAKLFYAHLWPHRAMVLRTAHFLSRDATLAEDLAQETLVKAFSNISQFDPATNARAWLSTILRNTWIDYLRAHGHEAASMSLDSAELNIPDRSSQEPAIDGHDPAALLERFSDAQIITALHELPAEIRWTLLLVDVEQLNQDEAAKILDIPVGTVKSRAHRGRAMMRDRLLNAGPAPPAPWREGTMMNPSEQFEDRSEEAIRERLSRLGQMPMDTSHLERVLRGSIPPPPLPAWRRTLKPLAAIAASLLVVAVVGWALSLGGPVQASPALMAQMHRDILSGKIATVKADSIDQANHAIAALAGDFPKLPEPPGSHAMACCMQNVGNKKVACILLNDSGTAVTMVVAPDDALAPPTGTPVERNAQHYFVQAVGDLNMVMLEQDHQRVCLISTLPSEKLLDMAGKIKF